MGGQDTEKATPLAGGPPLSAAGAERRRTLVPLAAIIAVLIAGELVLRVVLHQPADFGFRGPTGVELERRVFAARREAATRVVFIGDSRVAWGIDARAFEQACAARSVRVVSANLALEGDKVEPALRRLLAKDVAADVVFIGASPRLIAPGAESSAGEVPEVAPADLLEYIVTYPIRSHVRVLKGRNLGRSFERWMQHRFRRFPPPPRWTRCELGNHVLLFVDSTQLGRLHADQLKLYKADLAEIDTSRAREHAATVAGLISQLHARGTRVVLMRMPVGPALRELEDSVFDLEAFTEELERQCPLLVLSPEPLNTEFAGRVLDLSHLPQDAARDFSARLAEELLRKDALRREPSSAPHAPR